MNVGGAGGPAPCPPSSSSLGPRQPYVLGFSAPKDPYWSPVCLLSAVGLSPNPRVATTSSSSSNSTSSFFRIGVSPGVSGTDGPRGQNTVHSAHGPSRPQLWRLKGLRGCFSVTQTSGCDRKQCTCLVCARDPTPPTTPGPHTPPPCSETPLISWSRI